jgi:TrmH family RNA methyltransferase
MKIITSRANPEIKHVTALHTKKGRTVHNEFIAQGIRTCQTLIQNDYKLIQLYVTEQYLQAAQAITEQITIVANSVMEKISSTKTANGIVGVFTIPEQPDFKKMESGLVLANITDPGNMGTLIRSTAAFGYKTVVVINGVDVWSPKVIQATAGTIALLNVFCTSWKTLVLNKKDIELCALVVANGTDPSKLDKSKKRLLVVGNEAHGLPDEQLTDCTEQVTIPMLGKTESLNASVAGSIGLYLLQP